MNQGERLKIARLKRGLTQEELAIIINRSVSQVTRYENSITPIPLEISKIIAEQMDVSLAYLLGVSDSIKDAVTVVPVIHKFENGIAIIDNLMHRAVENLPVGELFYVVSYDQSMSPYICKNALVLFEEQNDANDMDVVCIKTNDSDYLIIRQLRVESGQKIFVPFQINEKIYVNNERNNIKIIGRFIEATNRI